MIPIVEDEAVIEYDPAENQVVNIQELIKVVQAMKPGESVMIQCGEPTTLIERHYRIVQQ